MSLTFDEACRLVKPGYYFKHMHNSWSEYVIQYGRGFNGDLFWTAGHTAGGPLTKRRLETNNSGFHIYAHWGDRLPIDPSAQETRTLTVEPDETCYKTPEEPIEVEHSLKMLYLKRGNLEVYNTYDLDGVLAFAEEERAGGAYPGVKVDPKGEQHLLILNPAFDANTPDEVKLAMGYGLVRAYGMNQRIELKESNVENVAVAVDEKDTTEIIKNDQDLFISKLNDIVDGIASDEGGEAGHGARLAISQTLDVLDGKDGGQGYFLIAKNSGQEEESPYINIAGNLGELFEGINS